MRNGSIIMMKFKKLVVKESGNTLLEDAIG